MGESTTDPGFWELFGMHTPDWDELDSRERCVAVHADQKGLFAEIISYFLGHRVPVPSGGAWQYCTDVKLIEQEIGSFGDIVKRFADAGSMEVRRAKSRDQPWSDAIPLRGAELTRVVDDAKTWTSWNCLPTRPTACTPGTCSLCASAWDG